MGEQEELEKIVFWARALFFLSAALGIFYIIALFSGAIPKILDFAIMFVDVSLALSCLWVLGKAGKHLISEADF